MDQDSYGWWKNQLEKDEARLKELEEKGVHALYKDEDITPASIGEQNVALEMSKERTRNHIKYDKERIA